MADNTVEVLKNVLNTASGIEYCGGDPEFYVEMLQDYLDGDKTELLEQYYAAEDWDNYRIQIHAVKSTSLMIGGDDVSAKAKELEFAIKDGNFGLVKEKHASVMSDYTALMDTIRNAI